MQFRHFLVAACLCASATAQIFVNPTGSDVTGNGTAGNPYRTIGFAAAQATAGTTIRLSAGTFGDDDQIVLGDKDLTLAGAGMGQTIVRPHAVLTQTFPAGFLPGTPTEHRVAIAVEGAARIDMRDFTIDCMFNVPSSGRLYGLYFRDGGDGTVQRVEVINARFDPLDADQRPAAAVVRGDNNADPCNVSFRECMIAEWHKVGIASFFNAAIEVEWCRVLAAGSLGGVGPAQVGVQIGYGSNGLLRHNTITDAYDETNSSASVGVLMYNAGSGCRVEANTVARCEDSIATAQQPSASVLLFVRNNNCTAAYGRAMRIDDQTTVLVTNNTLHANELTVSPVWDTAASGTTLWQNNNYSDYSGTGSYTIPGGGSVDALPRNGCDEFGLATTVNVGMFVEEMVVGDFDGQNELDFAVIRRGASPRLVIARENGAGGYTQQAIPFANSAALAVAIVKAEINGQPGIDLVVLTRNTNPALRTQERFWVFLNNGAGTFSAVSLQNLPPATVMPRDMAAGDLNGDGRDDLIIACAGNGVLPGFGLVLFNPAGPSLWTVDILPGITAPCQAVAIGDIDGNGTNDAAVVEASNPLGRARVFSNNGVGAFSEVNGSPVSIDNSPTAVAMLDADSDGDLDILTTSLRDATGTLPGTMSIITNHGTTLSARTVPTDLRPIDIATGDVAFDSDPQTVRPDAVVANFGGPSTTLVGEFSAKGPGLGSLCVRGAPPTCVSLGDMDGDGYQDLVVGSAGRTLVTIQPGVPLAREDLFGFGCAGAGGRVPLISPSGNPGTAMWPNTTYGIRISNALPNTPAVLVMSAFPGAPLVPCGLNVGPIAFSTAINTDGTGAGVLPLPIPMLPKVFGAIFYVQWAAVDFSAPFLGFLSLSQGMQIRVGN